MSEKNSDTPFIETLKSHLLHRLSICRADEKLVRGTYERGIVAGWGDCFQHVLDWIEENEPKDTP